MTNTSRDDGGGDQLPIEDHVLLGDTRTAALVGSDGAINWMCIPRFDSEPVFGRLVGGPTAGTFKLGPEGPARVVARRYRPATVTAETTWETATGRLTLTEGMIGEVTGRLLPATLLVRRLSATGGPIQATIMFDPRLGADRRTPRSQHRGELLVCSWPGIAIALHAAPHVVIEPSRPATVTVNPGEPLTIVMAVAHREPLVHVSPAAAWAALEADEQCWQTWCRDIDERLPQRETVVRSLFTLRLLTYSPSGAPVAAPTTSLPEHLGGVRNWDYRFAWPRDASIGIGAFLGVGKTDEARRFMAWLLNATRLDRPHLPVLLTLDGRHPRPEHELNSWPGYAHSRPVRTGNDAANQHQLDGYGWILDAAWLLTKAGHHLYAETWRAMAGFADTVAARWSEPDAGIWEIRGPAANHVHSKVMAWLALDRALSISAHQRTSARRRQRWADQRDALAAEIASRGVDPTTGSLSRTYGSHDVDAALLVLPLLNLVPPDSDLVRATIDTIRRDLHAGVGLLYRYPPGQDGLPGTEGAFLPCSFWLVQALATSGRSHEATELFEHLMTLASPLGLYAEEIDPATGRHLGNFPQALTHSALVQAALALRDATDPG